MYWTLSAMAWIPAFYILFLPIDKVLRLGVPLSPFEI